MYYNKTKEDVVKELSSDIQTGLNEQQVSAQRNKYGFNELVEQKKQSLLVKFLLQFTDPLIIILIVAAIVSIIAEPGEWVDSLIIVVVVMLNAILGVYQENSAEKSLEALKKMSAPNAKVIRNNERVSIPSRELVVGDIVSLEAGDYIPSDGRILESFNLKVDESALTGESLPVNKVSSIIEQEEVALGDQKNMVFASTVCNYGRGSMIVTSVGMENEVGKIASMLMQATKETTPLQIKLSQVSKVISMMCIVICIVVFGLEFYNGLSVLDSFKTAVALAVAAIPEGLATVVTIVLSMGVTKMAKKNAIVRKLPAVETLGSASVVCSDKTGTLTQNKMKVVKIEDLNTKITEENKKNILKLACMCTDCTINEKNVDGEPTEVAIVNAALEVGENKNNIYKIEKRVNEIPFDSERKLMTTIHKVGNRYRIITKGAPDVLIKRCSKYYEEGIQKTITSKQLNGIDENNNKMANNALRVLAIAYKDVDRLPNKIDSENIEKELTFVGLIGMIDPPREGVKEAVATCRKAGIKTVMITGDHITTAKAIAREIGILKPNDLAITGSELDSINQKTLEKDIMKYSVFARVSPEHKVRIVKAFRSTGAVVAMTGDRSK